MVTAYQLLGIPENASSTEILRAYRKEMLKYHPDRNPGHAGEEKAKLLNRAKDLLTDPVKRGRYDEYLRKQKATATKPIAAERSAQGDVKADEEPISTSDEPARQSSELDTNEFAWLNELQGEQASPRANEYFRKAPRPCGKKSKVRKKKRRTVPMFISVPIGGISGLLLSWLLLKLVFHRDLLGEFYVSKNSAASAEVRVVERYQDENRKKVPPSMPYNGIDVPVSSDTTSVTDQSSESEQRSDQEKSSVGKEDTEDFNNSEPLVELGQTASVTKPLESSDTGTTETLASFLPRMEANTRNFVDLSANAAAEITIVGDEFSLKPLRTKQQMFSNRTTYPWKMVPDGLLDWVFTYAAVGKYPNYLIDVRQPGNVHILVAAERVYNPERFEDTKKIFDAGWLPQKLVFANFGPYVLFSRHADKGEMVKIPHFHTFAYTIIVHPQSRVDLK